jgi:hypothetical protein
MVQMNRELGWRGVVIACLWLGCGGGGGGGANPPAGGDGGRSEGSAGGDTPGGPVTPAARALRVVSAPVQSAIVGEPMRYRVIASLNGARFEPLDLPSGATLDTSGNLSWTPTMSQSGPQRMRVRVQAGGETVDQDIALTVAAPQRQRIQVVDQDAPAATTVSVDAPLSSIRGTAIQLDPGSLFGTQSQLSVTISSVKDAPVPPAARVARVAVGDLRPVELGPSGTAFRRPVPVQLPVSAALLKAGRVAVATLDPATGAWERLQALAVDEVQGLVTAQVKHFSTYVVVPDLRLIDATLGKGPAGSSCASSLIVRAGLSMSPGELPADTVNGFTGKADNVAAVLAGLKAGQALQVFLQAVASGKDGVTTRPGWLLASAAKDDAGQLRVAITSDQHASGFLTLPGALAPTDPQLLALLAGSRANLMFPGLGEARGGVSVTIDLSLYLVDALDANRPPVNAVNPVAHELFEAVDLASVAPGDPAYDQDCDQAPDGADPDPRSAPPPQLSGTPPSPLHLLVGQDAALAVTGDSADVTFTWAASDPSLGLTAMGAGATLKPTQPGVYHVDAAGKRGAIQSRVVWDVLVDAGDSKTMNTPPVVQISASASVVRAGEVVTLAAIGRDREQVNLQYAWQASDATVLSAAAGERVAFTATAPGDYEIRCVASDGLAESAPASVILTVLSAGANRPPQPPLVTPLSAMVTHPPGEPVKVTLSARADDPDGDSVTFDFVPDPAVSRAVSLAKAGATAEVSTVVDGVFVFYVTAQDSHGATSPPTAVRIQVLPPAALDRGGIDADGDGYPAGVDCNDADPQVFPGSREICGDGIDQDCDGRDPTAGECDADHDGFSAAQGDCDDSDPRRNPGMAERCDGVDNNCNGQVDEGFAVGQPCAAGVGACRASGKTRCSATFVSVVCDAQPGRPAPETCDMIDNDCNGRVDDLMRIAGGTVDSCGACATTCPRGPNTMPLCAGGGCLAVCLPGFVDLDRDPQNGCECALSNGGVEICDGLDNDCNGQIDDGITEKSYGGGGGTLGVGVCTAGARVCRGGMLTEDRAGRLPTAEVCDGLDNDCNGKVDELFDFKNDPFNCGACGIACGPSGHCEQGRCLGASWDGGAPPPPPPPPTGGAVQVQIGICPLASGGTSCVDLLSDPANCGGCGRTCPGGTACITGMCMTVPAGMAPPPVQHPQCPLAPPGDGGAGGCSPDLPDSCKDQTGGVYCTNLRFDNASCGACGRSCPAGTACREGACTSVQPPPDGGTAGPPPCQQPFKLCSDPFGAPVCTDLTRDPFNCGGCSLVCGMGNFCEQGKCAAGTLPPPPDGGAPPPPDGGMLPPQCPTGLSSCGPPGGPFICTDLGFDRNNCGGCGKVCPPDQVCSGAVCKLPPPPPDGAPPPPDGGGTFTCDAPTTLCQDPTGKPYCADLGRDRYNCGACGKGCSADQICQNSTCQVPPPPPGDGGTMTCTQPLSPCGGAVAPPYCADLSRDLMNCGACNKVCAMGQSCVSGVCSTSTMTCNPPLSPCQPPQKPSYCADLNVDNMNCGACGHPCVQPTVCRSGVCQ